MLDSFQIAAVLMTRGFDPITQPTRTKAHGYQHPRMLHPVYVKIRGPKGDLRAAVESPLVIHRADAQRIEAAGRLPDGVTLNVAPYHSAGLLAYRERKTNTPSGRALTVSDGVSLNRLLDVLLDNGATGSPHTVLADVAATKELAYPDSWQSRASAAAVDADPQSENIGASTRVALINA